MSQNTPFALSAALIMVLAAVVVSPVSAQDSPCIPSITLPGCPTQEQLSDSSGNGHHLSMYGLPASRDSPMTKYGAGFNLDGTDDYLEQRDQAFAITGDLTIFIAAEFDDPSPSRQERIIMHGAQGETESTNFLYMLDRETDGRIQYMHEYTGASNLEFFSTTSLTAGFHAITLVRDVSERRVIVTIDGQEVINQQWSPGQHPVGGASGDLFLGSSLPQDDWFMDGGIYEARIWDHVVPAPTLAQIADPNNQAYANAPEGSEIPLWLMGDSPPNPPPEEEETCLSGELDEAVASTLCPETTLAPGRLPANWLDSFEFVASDAAPAVNHDWDGDGLPDILDAINLPSESQQLIASTDSISLAQGLALDGFVLLVAPDGSNAMLVTGSTGVSLQSWNASQALDWFEDRHGVQARNTMAHVLYEDTSVEMLRILADTPRLDQSLPWQGIPVDGSWLLVRTDPTRVVQLELGGVAAPVAPPLASRPTQLEVSLRWEFVNFHKGTSFCYDDVMQTGASACTGNTDPGWIRAYSGQAAAMLEAVEASLAMGLVDFHGRPAEPQEIIEQTIDDVVSAPHRTPDLRSSESSEVAVDGSTDTFTFATGSAVFNSQTDVRIVLVAPNGREMTFSRLGTEPGSDSSPQVWRLDGTHVSGPAGWNSIGSLHGVPADGTWQWSIHASPFYDSRDGSPLMDSEPDVTLFVAGKTIRSGYQGAFPAFNNPQIWNWHVTPPEATFQDDQTQTWNGADIETIDANIADDEDPTLARYYVDDLEIHVLPESASQVSVTAADTFTFATGLELPFTQSANFVLTAPNGKSMTFARGAALQSQPAPQVWSLDGTRVSGAEGWITEGSLVGAPADGTWQWSVVSEYSYKSIDDWPTGMSPDVSLSVAGKEIRAPYNGGLAVLNNPQQWNWHITAPGATFQDGRIDEHNIPETIEPDEDPRYARYYYPAPTTAMSTSQADTPSTNASTLPPLEAGDAGIPPSFRVPQSDAPYSAFDEDSPWRVIGNQSRDFGHGVGIDYVFGLDGLAPGQALVTQATSLVDASLPSALRPFHFQGTYMHLPAEPEPLRHVAIGIESLDGPAGQTFVLDGRALDALLDLDGAPHVEIDEDHEEGFAYEWRDVNGDGYMDIIAHVPHFSQAWLTVSSNPCSGGRFWDAEITGLGTAWITSNCGRVYRYTGTGSTPTLQGYSIPGLTSAYDVLGIHVLGSNEFYVVGGSRECPSSVNRGFIAYYNNGFQTPQYFDGGACSSFYDIWVNPGRTRGLAGGDGLFMEYNGVTWSQVNSPGRPANGCGVMDIEFNDQGRGYLALSYPQCQSASPVTPIMYFDGVQFTTQSIAAGAMYDVRDANGAWAAGAASSSRPGIYQQWGSWSQASGIAANSFFGVTQMPGTDTTWFSGNDASQKGLIVKHRNSLYESGDPGSGFTVTTNMPSKSRLWDIEAHNSQWGLAVGEGTILYFEGNSPPVASANLSPVVLQTRALTTGTGSAQDDDDAQSKLTFTWDWGDGSSSDTATASHAYNNPGTYNVKFTASDGSDSDSKSFTVTVNPETISLGQSDQVSLSSGQRHHYVVSSSAGKYVEAKLSSCSGAKLLARTGSPVGSEDSAPAWPTSPQSNTLLAGYASSTLYLAIDRASGSGTCTLSVKVIPLPSTPVIQSLASKIPTNTGIELKASAGHLGGYGTRIEVNWGDGAATAMPSTGVADAGTQLSSTHSYSVPATRTVTLRAYDEFGQASTSMASAIVDVRDPATSAVNPATNIGFYEATLSGSITDWGGAPSSTTKARYLVYHGGGTTPVKTSSWTTGSVPSWTATSLTSGTLYSYRLQVDNGAWLSTSDAVSFQTVPTTSATTSISGPSNPTRGVSATYTFDHSPPESGSFRYHVSWGDGTTSTTAWFTGTTARTLSHTYAFPYGSIQVSAQMEITSGSRTASAVQSITVGGSSPVESVTYTPKAGAADLSAWLDDAPSGAWGRITYYDAASASWKISPWNSGLFSAFGWTATGLDASKTYQAHVEFSVTSGATVWRTPESWSFQSNARPVLSTDAVAKTYNYLDPVRLSVVYSDRDGDAPSSVTVTVNGVTKTMHSTGSNYKAGVEYYYVFKPGELPAPGSYVPKYSASDAYQAAISKWGGSVFVKQAAVAAHTFEQDAPGSTPTGFTKSGEELNYWQVVDTDDPRMPDYVALGNHGKAAWFGRMPAASYADPAGGSPRGSLYSAQYDLSTVQDPVMSFSSYYDTEDLSNSKDRKEVYLSYKNPGASLWQSTLKVLDVKGHEGGYKKWTTQTIDLALYAGKVVQFEFRFDTRGNQDNNRVGWLIDDVGIGQDSDLDGLPDALESARYAPVSRARIQQPVPLLGGQTNAAVIHGITHPGAENFVMRALLHTRSPSDVEVHLVAHPFYATTGHQGNEMTLLHLPKGFVNGVSGTVGCDLGASKPTGLPMRWIGTSPGAPYGFLNLPPPNGPEPHGLTPPPASIEYEVTDNGIILQGDLIQCMEAAGAPALDGFLAQDLALRVTNHAVNPLVISDFFVLSTGRTSVFEWDSDGDGDGDEEDRAGSTPLGIDRDRDRIPAAMDVDDTVPQLINSIVLDASKLHVSKLRVRVSEEVQVVSFKASTREGATIHPAPMKPAGRDGSWRVYEVDVSRPGDVTIALWDIHAGVTRIELTRPNSFESVRYSYKAADVDATWEFPAKTIVPGTTHLVLTTLDFVPAIEAGMTMATLLSRGPPATPAHVFVDAATAVAFVVAEAVLIQYAESSNTYVAFEAPESQFTIRQPWTDAQGIRRASAVFDNYQENYHGGLSLSEARALLESDSTAMRAGGSTQRVWKDDGSSVSFLEGNNNAFFFGKKIPTSSWNSMLTRGYIASDDEAAVDLISVERIVADTLYGKNGAIDEDLACHVQCYARQTMGRFHFVDPSWIEPREGPGGPVRYFSTSNFDGALRKGEQKLSDAQAPADFFMAQNTLGVESLLYSYRMAHQSPNTKGPEFDAYWGDRLDDPACDTQLSDRRCTMPVLWTRFNVNPNTWGSDPFRIRFVQDGGSAHTEAMTVHGQYTRYYPAQGQSVGQGILDEAEADGHNFLANQWSSGQGLVAAFDLTDVWRDERFNTDYGVVIPEDSHFRHGYKVT